MTEPIKIGDRVSVDLSGLRVEIIEELPTEECPECERLSLLVSRTVLMIEDEIVSGIGLWRRCAECGVEGAPS